MAELLGLSLYNDANLQEYYKLEDTSGKNGNTLTNNNTVAFNAAKFNNGADGGSSNTNKYLNVASALSYAGGAYSISLWIKLQTEIPSGVYDICELQETTTDTTLLFTYEYNSGTRRLNCGRLRPGVSFDGIAYNTNLGTTVTHHIVLTYSGSTVHLYVDNVDVGNIASSGGGSVNQTSGFEILSGRSVTNFTSAIIDDVALFDRELTSGEVNTIYTETASNNGYFHMSV